MRLTGPLFCLMTLLIGIVSMDQGWADSQKNVEGYFDTSSETTSEITPETWQVRALLAAERETVLSSRISGYIERMTVSLSDRFVRGQVLVSMACSIQKAEVAKAKAELRDSEHNLSVQNQLEALKSGSSVATNLAVTNVEKARADLDIKRAIVEMCVIKAPYKGRVVERTANAYQTVTQGQPLMEILDDSSLEIRLITPSRWLGWLKPGMVFTLHLDETQKTYPSQITKIGARIDPASQSINLVGRINGTHPELIAGMSGMAHFPMNAE